LFVFRRSNRSQSPYLPWGLVLLRDVSTERPLCSWHPSPAYVPSPAFLALSTVSSAHYLAGLFHPAATSKVCTPRVSPIISGSGSSPSPALLSLARFAFDCRSNLPVPRAPPSGLCSNYRSVVARSVVTPGRALVPFLRFRSRRFPPSFTGTAFTVPPLMAFLTPASQ